MADGVEFRLEAHLIKAMPPQPMHSISLIVITYNEAANIARCLDSVSFAAEKIVIDCGSEDDTRADCRRPRGPGSRAGVARVRRTAQLRQHARQP